MPVKQWFRKLQPMQLYIVLAITVAFFLVELVASHVTHALTLLMDSYHMLCNIMALTGCIITIKYGHKTDDESSESSSESLQRPPEIEELKTKCQDDRKIARTRAQQEKRLKNTFGWARIDVISMLICCVFLASLCFSIVLDGLQTLVHIDHKDEMHHPIAIMCIGGTGLLLNGLCYLLIGGYTFHQGSFLYVTESGDVVLDKVVISNSIRKGERRLSRTRINMSPPIRQRQGFCEMLRDVLGCVLVILCALVVYLTDASVAKYVDPVFSIVSAVALMILSYPYMKESCLILLQTIPDSVNINSLHTDLLKQFPDIVNVHDLHVWELSANKVVSTVHVIFQNPKVYARIVKDVKDFFAENGITQVTIQPEFYTKSPSTESLPITNCLVQCQGDNCRDNSCCPNPEKKIPGIVVMPPSKERIPSNLELDLKSIRILDNELSSSSSDVTDKVDVHTSSDDRSESSDDNIGPESPIVPKKQEDEEPPGPTFKTEEYSVTTESTPKEEISTA